MIKNVDKEQFVDESSVLADEMKSIVTKVRNLAASSVKKMFVRSPKKSVKMDLFGNTLYNNSLINHLKEEENKRIASMRRPIEFK
ncbi:MAG: hypothetical protein ACXAEU_18610 [Candidatus Hodarchaeales archaeon]|jgi:hypothetical protein